MTDRKSTGQFGAGNPGKPKGAANKTTKTLREAILLAAEQSGGDGKGKGGLVGYLKRVAYQDVKAFAGLLGRVLPLQVQGDPNNPLIVQRVERAIVKPDGQNLAD